jgi:hypothetical protein
VLTIPESGARKRGRADLETQQERIARQPGLGLAGILLVLPVAIPLAVGFGAFEPSLQVLGPISTCALPGVAMIGFLWEDWPGTRVRAPLSGVVNTLLIILGGILLTFVAQLVAYGRLDGRGVFAPAPAVAHAPTFPATMPLAAAAFVAVLQLVLVSDGWPVSLLGRLPSGPAALLASWAAAVALYFLLVRTHPKPGSGLRPLSGPLTGAQLGALLVAIGVWQVLFFVSLRGWPFAEMTPFGRRLAAANAVVLGAGAATYTVLRAIGSSSGTISAVGGAVIAAALVVSMLFDNWPASQTHSARQRLVMLAVVATVAAALYAALTAIADSARWTMAKPDEWVAFACLNAIGLGVILHVAVGRRWPFATASPGGDVAIAHPSISE